MVRLFQFIDCCWYGCVLFDTWYTLRFNIMQSQLLDTIKENLLERERKLMAELEALTGQTAAKSGEYQLIPPDYGSDEDENSEEVATFTTDLAVKEVLEASLRDVRSALDRIAQGTYGTCKYCGKEIDERRLLARPASSSCVHCKESLKAVT